MIAKFRSSPFHFFNEMNKLGLTEQQLLDHLTRISAPNEWGTDLELRMLGALAGIDVVSIMSWIVIVTDGDWILSLTMPN